MIKYIELQNWGYNYITFFSLAAVLFVILEGWGFLRQNKKIWKNESAESVSINMFIYLMYLLLAFLIYGFFSKELTVILYGLLFIFVIPILAGLKKYHWFTLSNKVVFAVCMLVILIMILFPVKEIIFILFLLGSNFFLILQPWEMLKKKNNGVLDVGLIIIYLAGTLVWIFYSFFIEDKIIFITSLFTLAIFCIIVFLWFYYELQKEVKDENSISDFTL